MQYNYSIVKNYSKYKIIYKRKFNLDVGTKTKHYF